MIKINKYINKNKGWEFRTVQFTTTPIQLTVSISITDCPKWCLRQEFAPEIGKFHLP
jgi:hypothetical protein